MHHINYQFHSVTTPHLYRLNRLREESQLLPVSLLPVQVEVVHWMMAELSDEVEDNVLVRSRVEVVVEDEVEGVDKVGELLIPPAAALRISILTLRKLTSLDGCRVLTLTRHRPCQGFALDWSQVCSYQHSVIIPHYTCSSCSSQCSS